LECDCGSSSLELCGLKETWQCKRIWKSLPSYTVCDDDDDCEVVPLVQETDPYGDKMH
jgi:hypothetical protein